MKLFKGTFNWYCELHVLYTHAESRDRAFNNFVIRLMKTLKVSRGRIYGYFLNENINNWEVKKIKEVRIIDKS